jgi:methionyl-tRNA synthetase
MAWKFSEGKLSRPVAESIDIREQYDAAMAEHFIHQGLSQALQLATFCNERIDSQKPWALAKDPAQREALDGLLYWLAESLRIIAILISPVLPGAAHRIFDQLNWQPELSGKEERFSLADAEWGRLPDGHLLGKPVPLFPRIEMETESTA